MELLRQPVFLLLMTCSAVFAVFLASTPYFGFGDDPKLVKDSVLATILMVGLFAAVISASSSVAQEIRTGTALAVLSKPIGRIQFIIAKYIGLAGALAVLTYVNLVSALLASRMAFTAYGEADSRSFFIFTGALALAYAIAGFSNYFLHRTFVSDAVIFVVILSTIAAAICANLERPGSMFEDHIDVDWRLVPATLLILFAFLVLAALALGCSTRLEMIPTLAICTGLFLIGLMSDYLLGRHAEPAWKIYPSTDAVQSSPLDANQRTLLTDNITKHDQDGDGRLSAVEQGAMTPQDKAAFVEAGLGGKFWAATLYAVIPNWQLFWLADALEGEKKIPWTYVGYSFLYTLCYLTALLALAIILFEDRELN